MERSMTLILGGARSGKSHYAQELVKRSGQTALFLATATASDEEMRARIAAHRAARPAGWQTLEAPLQAGEAIRKAPPTDWVLLDCVTMLASNILLSLPEPVQETAFDLLLDTELDSLMEVFENSRANWVIVSNEVGLGLVPPYPLGRFFRDGLGRANQRLAQAANTVLLMVAGIPMAIKGEAPKPH